MHPTPALIPLSLLEAVQNIDTPADDGLGALEQELAAKRLGLSPTVAAQVARYRQQVRAGADVPADDALAIFRLVGRRPDAGLVYADAGRRAARYAARRRTVGQRVGIAMAPGRLGLSMALNASAHIAQRWLGADLRAGDGRLRCEMTESMALHARDDGTACQFYTSAFAELLRQVGGLEWSVMHELCCGRGDRQCLWRAMRAEAYE